jgi:hypothetical protein
LGVHREINQGRAETAFVAEVHPRAARPGSCCLAGRCTAARRIGFGLAVRLRATGRALFIGVLLGDRIPVPPCALLRRGGAGAFGPDATVVVDEPEPGRALRQR